MIVTSCDRAQQDHTVVGYLRRYPRHRPMSRHWVAKPQVRSRKYQPFWVQNEVSAHRLQRESRHHSDQARSNLVFLARWCQNQLGWITALCW